MLTFAGKGYSPDFISNFERITDLIAGGEQMIEIVMGPDDICAPLLGDPECHCRNASVAQRDRLAAESLTDLLHQRVQQGATFCLDLETLSRLRQAFAAGTIRKACQGCQWSPFCDVIAEGGFRETRGLCGK
jgi:uncharacterized protein